MCPVQPTMFSRHANGFIITFSDSLPKIEVAVHYEYWLCLSGVSGSSTMGCRHLFKLLEFGSCWVLTVKHTWNTLNRVILFGLWGCIIWHLILTSLAMEATVGLWGTSFGDFCFSAEGSSLGTSGEGGGGTFWTQGRSKKGVQHILKSKQYLSI